MKHSSTSLFHWMSEKLQDSLVPEWMRAKKEITLNWGKNPEALNGVALPVHMQSWGKDSLSFFVPHGLQSRSFAGVSIVTTPESIRPDYRGSHTNVIKTWFLKHILQQHNPLDCAAAGAKEGLLGWKPASLQGVGNPTVPQSFPQGSPSLLSIKKWLEIFSGLTIGNKVVSNCFSYTYRGLCG